MSQEDEADKEIDREFLKGLKVYDKSIDKTLTVLQNNEVNITALLTIPSEERLRSLKTKNERGEELTLGEGTIGILWKYIEDARASFASNQESAWEDTLRFEETAFPPRLHFDFVPPPCFDTILRQTVKSMTESVQREQVYFVLTGPMGVGKSRTGHELVQSAIERVRGRPKSQRWRHGYLAIASSLPYHKASEELRKDDNECYNVLAHALVASLCPPGFPRPPRINFERVSARIKSSLECDCVILHVDEFAENPFSVMMMMRACVLTAIRPPGTTLRVHMVVTGVRSLLNLQPLTEGTRYRVMYETLSALDGQDALALNTSVASQLGFQNFELFAKCTRLHNLIMDCGGFPVFVEELIMTIKDMEDPLFQQGLVEGGQLDVSKAEAIYDELVTSIALRYSEVAWANMMRLQDEEEKQRISLATKRMLRRIVLDVITGARIDKHGIIYQKGGHEITYRNAETSGLIAVMNDQVNIPLLAISTMNKYLKVVDGDVLKNPFVYGFQIHEQLALVSLQARLRRMNIVQVKQCTLAELRPGALFCGDYSDLSLDVPQGPQEDIAILQVGTFFEKNSGGLRIGAEGKGGPPPKTPGTFLMSAEGQESVDGVLYFEGTYKSKKCRVLLLSQSKWSQLFYAGSTRPSTSTVTTGTVKDILKRMRRMKDAVIESWFGGLKKSEHWVFIYDIFTDRNQGARMNIEELALSTREAMVVTTDLSIESVVGPVLGVRSRLKRIVEDEEVFVSNRKRQQQ